LKDFTFIFWELKRRNPYSVHGGYPCIGYPQADKLVPAFERVGANFQIIEFCDYSSLGLQPGEDQKDPFKTLGSKIESDNVLIEWDGITSHRDYQNIFKWNKKLYVIPHFAGAIAGFDSLGIEQQIRKEVTDNSIKVIFELQWERDFWKNLECNKFIIMNPPTRTGTQFDKLETRKALGISTKYAIICWGNYEFKSYEEMIPWIAEWKDTSLLFVGSGNEEAMRLIAKAHNIERNVFFSRHGISDVDADLWFSASDLCTLPRRCFGSSTPTHVIGQGKCMITQSYPAYIELEKISGIVTSSDLKKTTRELLLDEEKRKVFELKSQEYARNNSFEQYAIRIGKLMNLNYQEGKK